MKICCNSGLGGLSMPGLNLDLATLGNMSHPRGTPVPIAGPPTGQRVLVVDDERAIADLVGSYLTRDGFEVSLA